MKEVVTFFLSGKEYGADVSEIQGIENYVEYAKEPGLSDGFLGIVSIRDEWVPLLNLKKKLVLPPVPRNRGDQVSGVSAAAGESSRFSGWCCEYYSGGWR